jgi:zinc/manganese transport system ATP-binding protein
MDTAKPVVEAVGVEVAAGDYVILSDVNLRLEGPGLVQILGPNGAGKTTLLRTLLGLIRPRKGRVYINGVDVTGRPEKAGRYSGYVPQLEGGGFHYPVTAWELVETECRIRCRGAPREEVERRVREAFRTVSLSEEALHRPISRLSGGQRQRVFIARALVHRPPILFMDEPFSAIDPAAKASLADTIGRLSDARLVVVTSHDPLLLMKYTRLIVLVKRGIVAAGAPGEVLREEILSRVYGGSVIAVERHLHIADEHGRVTVGSSVA